MGEITIKITWDDKKYPYANADNFIKEIMTHMQIGVEQLAWITDRKPYNLSNILIKYKADYTNNITICSGRYIEKSFIKDCACRYELVSTKDVVAWMPMSSVDML